MARSDPRQALIDLFGCIQSTFKRDSRTARREAWESLQSGKGKQAVSKILNNPSFQVIGLQGMVKFKEWFYEQENSCSDMDSPSS